MSDTWSTLPFLGLVPHFHTDPAQDGPPLVSADGHWWWDGDAWTPVRGPETRTPDARQPAPALAGVG